MHCLCKQTIGAHIQQRALPVCRYVCNNKNVYSWFGEFRGTRIQTCTHTRTNRIVQSTAILLCVVLGYTDFCDSDSNTAIATTIQLMTAHLD